MTVVLGGKTLRHTKETGVLANHDSLLTLPFLSMVTSYLYCRFETLAWVSPFIYTPFYFVAIYAFICEKEWIRIPG